MSKVKSGGGLHSNKLVTRKSPKVEPKAYAINPAGVRQLGNTIDPKEREPLNAGRGYSPPVGPTDNVAAVGVGGGRTIMPSGGQGLHGPVNRGEPPAAGRDILGEFGPDKRT